MKANPNWKRISIKDVCESITDCVNKTASTVNYPTEFKMIRTTNVKKGWVDLSEVKYVTREVFEKWTRRVIPKKGDIILTREAPLGEVGMLRTTDNIFLGQRLVQYRANPRYLDNRFLLYTFQGLDLQSQIKALGSGATVEHMRVPDAEKLTLLLPSLPTQHKIASILSAYDDLIENNTRRIAILEEMAQTIYQEWFVHFRYPGYEKNKMVESELGMIPEEWNVVKFTGIADVLSGGTPRTANQEYWNGQIPFFAPRDAKSSFYTLETEQYITELGLKSCNSKLYPGNTVFITARGTVGKVLLNAVDMAMNQSCYALRGKDGIRQYFLFMAVKNCINQLKAQANGAVFDTITVDTFRRLEILKPSSILIKEFSDVVDPMFQQILNLLKRNKLLRQTRGIILPKLISGEIDVETLDIDIPAIPEPEAQQNTAPIVQPESIDASQLAFLF